MKVFDEFKQFSALINEHNEKRERVIRLSRDLTQLSKKLIFTLHRLSSLVSNSFPSSDADSTPEDQARQDVLVKAKTELDKILNLIRVDILQKELDHNLDTYHKYHGQLTNGIQEFVESYLFYDILIRDENGTGVGNTLISVCSCDQLNRQLHPTFNLVSHDDYLLGLADLTGELMRYGIATVGSDPAITKQIQHFLSRTVTDYSMIIDEMKSQSLSRDESDSVGEAIQVDSNRPFFTLPIADQFDKKLDTMKQSLFKIENGILLF